MWGRLKNEWIREIMSRPMDKDIIEEIEDM